MLLGIYSSLSPAYALFLLVACLYLKSCRPQYCRLFLIEPP